LVAGIASTSPLRALNEKAETIHSAACGDVDCFAALAMTARAVKIDRKPIATVEATLSATVETLSKRMGSGTPQ
jgi:hypothetical protein